MSIFTFFINEIMTILEIINKVLEIYYEKLLYYISFISFSNDYLLK